MKTIYQRMSVSGEGGRAERRHDCSVRTLAEPRHRRHIHVPHVGHAHVHVSTGFSYAAAVLRPRLSQSLPSHDLRSFIPFLFLYTRVLSCCYIISHPLPATSRARGT